MCFMSSGRVADPRLRYRTLWLMVGWLLVGGVVFLTLTPEPPDMRAMGVSDKFAHAAGYMGMMGWFIQIFHVPRTRLYTGILLVAMGVGLEILQGLQGTRVMEFADMLANSAGVLLAWALAHTRCAFLLQWFENRVLGYGEAG